MSRRTHAQIERDIVLTLARRRQQRSGFDPAGALPRTRIIQKANLTGNRGWTFAYRSIDECVEKGLIARSEQGYLITTEGLNYLNEGDVL